LTIYRCFAALLSLALVAGSSALAGEPAVAAQPAEDWLTKAERTEFRETARYDEVVEYCKRLAAESDFVEYRPFGKSPLGRDMPLVIAASGGEFDPQKAKASGKRIVLIQNAIHSGECDGKDASLMLLREMVITKTREELLRNAIVLVIPIYNVDGHERFGPHGRINQNGPTQMGWRTTAQNLNLNRDYMKADAPETRAWLSLFNEWQPDLHIDTHTTNGGDWQYDIMLAWDESPMGAGPVVRWLKETLHENLMTGLAADGHVPAIYFDLNDSRNPERGITSGAFEPRFSNGYVSLRGRPSILVESHMLKPYRTRVMGTLSVLRNTLELVNRYADSLREAVAAADAQAIELGRNAETDRKLALVVRNTEEAVPFSFKGFAYERALSEISGAAWIRYDQTRPALFGIEWTNGTEPAKEVVPPVAYVFPPQWTDAIELLEAHGLRIERFKEPAKLRVESYRLSEPKFATRPFEGRFRASFASEAVKEEREFPAGSVIVPLDQVGSRVAVHLLEPDGPDSLVSWGFFNTIFEQKEYAEGYVLEKLAREMIESDPALRKEFEDKVASDAEFAKDARARLYFFYQRSPYWDAELGRYPVGRLTDDAWRAKAGG